MRYKFQINNWLISVSLIDGSRDSELSKPCPPSSTLITSYSGHFTLWAHYCQLHTDLPFQHPPSTNSIYLLGHTHTHRYSLPLFYFILFFWCSKTRRVDITAEEEHIQISSNKEKENYKKSTLTQIDSVASSYQLNHSVREKEEKKEPTGSHIRGGNKKVTSQREQESVEWKKNLKLNLKAILQLQHTQTR